MSSIPLALIPVMAVRDPRLLELEKVIANGMETFVQVGAALKEICESRLYREQGYKTFGAYCTTRWNLSRHSAYERIQAAAVVLNVGLSQQNAPTFTQARELAALPAEQQREVARTTDFTRITVKQIKQKVQAVKAGAPRPAASKAISTAPSKAPIRTDPDATLDELGGRSIVSFLRDLRSEITRRRKVAACERARREWNPDLMLKIEIAELIDWIECELDKLEPLQGTKAVRA